MTTTWDQLAVFPSGTTDQSARDALGYGLPIEALSPFRTPNSGSVFVLSMDRHLVAWFPLFRTEVVVRCLNQLTYAPADASFFVLVDGGVPSLSKTSEGC